MAATKVKGDFAELMVAADLARRGYRVAIPFGENSDYDLVVEREDGLERVQVKHARSDGHVIEVRPMSLSLTNGKVRRIKRYTSATIDWLAVYDVTTDRCYYIHASELGSGRRHLTLRLTAPRNGQAARIRYAADYLDLEVPRQQSLEDPGMEPAGLEPATSCLQGRRSPN